MFKAIELLEGVQEEQETSRIVAGKRVLIPDNFYKTNVLRETSVWEGVEELNCENSQTFTAVTVTNMPRGFFGNIREGRVTQLIQP